MRDPADFDAFYKDARDRLLLQAYALTGDLPAARAGVRDAFVGAWHHWRKVSRLADPETWLRHSAWTHAQRLTAARVWHRDKSGDPEVTATLEALDTLSAPQRKMMLLTALSSGSMADFAREVGLPQQQAEAALQQATAHYSLARDIASTEVQASLDPLRHQVELVTWPRITIIRRAGTARRRTHAALGALATVAALVISGLVVTHGGSVRPALADPFRPEEQAATVDEPSASADDNVLAAGDLLAPREVRRLAPRREWGEPTPVDGPPAAALPCWQAGSGDPSAASIYSSTVRAAKTPKTRRTPARGPLRVEHVSELSSTVDDAAAAFDTMLEWHAACAEPRMQLLQTYLAPGIGDQAAVLTLKAWAKRPTLITVAVARTGQIGTAIVARSKDGPAVPARSAARALARTVDRLCHRTGGASCSHNTRLDPAEPFPVGEVPGLLSELDLPGVTGVDKPWVGSVPRKATANFAASGCARANFQLDSMSNQMTRTFVIPGSKLPPTFGLTETAGTMPAPDGTAWINGLRRRLGACVDKRLGTTTSRVAQRTTKTQDLSVWHITTELSDTRSMHYLMAVMRNGTAVAQLGFIPARRAEMQPGAFVALAERALHRLARMPKPKKPKKPALAKQPKKKQKNR